jgi:hypothetical protein
VGVVIGLLRLRVVDLNVNLLFFLKKKRHALVILGNEGEYEES